MKVYTLNATGADGVTRGFGVYSSHDRAEKAAKNIKIGSMEKNFSERGEMVGWLIHEVTLDRDLPALARVAR